MPASQHVFAILSSLVEEKTGIRYGEEDAQVFLDKVTTRVQEIGFDSLLDYYYLLRYDDPDGRELDALIDVLVVPETYFFRELAPVELVVTDFIEPLVASGVRPRVWCAACATGEEPLTLAMLLANRGLLRSVDLVASDLSLRNLARAKECKFGARAIRGTALPPYAERYIRAEGKNVRIDTEVHSAIEWSRVNLVDQADVRRFGSFDVIVCRNVLIYFSDETTVRVLSSLAGALRSGGALLVGVSESLLRFGSSLRCEERRGTFLYRKALT